MTVRLDPARTLYLVDGTNNIFRAFYAIRGLRSSRGVPTNAVFGFVNMLRKLVKEHAPRYLAVAFDRAEPTFRHKAFADYKAHRPEAPPELIRQIPLVKRACEVLAVPVLEQAGYEADDVIGTLAERARDAGLQVVIVATDKDLLQLVGEGVLVYNPVSGEILDGDGVERTFGVRPEQVRDVLALCGDASDNIPGVPGIGEKGAKELIRRFGTLERVLEAAPALSRRTYREGLAGHADTARLSLDLATVRRDVPVEFELERFHLATPDAAAARDLFEDLEFQDLAREFARPAEAPAGSTRVVTDLDAIRELGRRLRAAGTFAIHAAGDHDEPMRSGLVGIALAVPAGETVYIPLGHRRLGTPRQAGEREVLEALRPALEQPEAVRAGEDAKGTLILLRRRGVRVPGFACDSMLAGYLLNPSRRSQDLAVVAREVAGLEVPGHEALLGTGAKRTPLAETDVELAAALLGARAAATLAIRERLEAVLRSGGLLDLYRDLELPLASVLADMEIAGVRVDTAFLVSLSAEWDRELQWLTAAIQKAAGRDFNINSPRQLGEILFETLKLTPGRRTRKTKSFSTGMEVLEELAREHELPRLILDYRSLQKLKSTYVDTLPQLVNPDTGRVHTSFNQAVAATGRLSSSDPNLQNIPIRTDLGRKIRRAFVPEPGHRLLSADYSQIELRILAHLCGDPALVGAFLAGEDIHRRTAAEVFGVMPALVTDEMRRRAKVVNFGLIYGMGPQRLAREQGIPLKEARDFIGRYFERLPRVREYLDAAVADAERDARVRTLFGRVRYFPEILGADRNARQQAVRAAVNMAIQGTAADLIKKAMVVLDERLRSGGPRARMILQVHDELVLEVAEDEVAACAALVRDVMEGIHVLDVPLKVDVSAGPNWVDLAPVPESKN
jgi:DNA polymerase-1